MTTTVLEMCVLCGYSGTPAQVAMRLIRWDDGTFGSGPRCLDRTACQERVKAIGDRWPVRDAGEYRP